MHRISRDLVFMDSKHEHADRLPGTSTKMTTLDTALRNVRQVQKKTVVFFSLISPKTFCSFCMFLRAAANVENGNQVGQVRIGNEFSTMYCMCLRFPLSRECQGADARYPLSCMGSGTWCKLLQLLGERISDTPFLSHKVASKVH